VTATDAPYVGPRAFQPGETLYGRDREQRDLLDLLIADRIILLYSPSGAGKTSIIQAALGPQLGDEDFEVLPTVRVNAAPPEGVEVNRYLYSVAKSLEPELPVGLAETAGPDGHTLHDLLGKIPRIRQERLAREQDPRAPRSRNVLVLDQFEEIFTADAADTVERREFFRQLGEALKDADLWALISMREDYIANLDPYASLIPTRLANRYRLELLGPEAAAAAIRLPAVAEHVDFDPQAASALVDNLRRIGTSSDDSPRLGPSVEPVHLQIACLDLWNRMQDKWNGGARHIGVEDIGAGTDVDEALGNYYNAKLAEIGAAETSAPDQALLRERRIREWIERNLITPEGIRAQVLQNSTETAELNDRVTGLVGEATVRRLVDAYLVRTEERANATWYELSHDRLVNPIRSRNAEWYRGNFSPFRNQAVMWRRRKDSDLLFIGAALDEATAWAEQHPERLGRTETSFLEASREARRRVRRDKRLRYTAFGALAGFLLLALVGAVVGWSWYVELRRAHGDAQIAKQERVEAEKGRAADAHRFAVREGVFKQREREFDRRQAENERLERQFRAREAESSRRLAEARQSERQAVAATARAQAETRQAQLAMADAQRLRDVAAGEAATAQAARQRDLERMEDVVGKLRTAMAFLATVQQEVNNPVIQARIQALTDSFAGMETSVQTIADDPKPAQSGVPSAAPPSPETTPTVTQVPVNAPPSTSPQGPALTADDFVCALTGQCRQSAAEAESAPSSVTATRGFSLARPLPMVGAVRRSRSAARAGAATIAQPRPFNPWGLKLWANGSTLRVTFLNGEPALRRRVLAVAQEWSEVANIRFVESEAADAEVRVSFEGRGGVSRLGTDSLSVPAGEATMQLGGLAEADEHRFRQSVLHEFGHVLGLIHEDTNPNGDIPWNEATLVTLFDRSLVEQNLLRRAELPRYRPFTNYSVMFLLSVDSYPATLFESHFTIRRTDRLSESDIAFIRELYPPG